MAQEKLDLQHQLQNAFFEFTSLKGAMSDQQRERLVLKRLHKLEEKYIEDDTNQSAHSQAS